LPQYENDLAWSRIKIGDILFQQNKTSEAEEKFLAAREIFKTLTGKEPSNLAWQASYSSSLSRLAQLYNRINVVTARKFLDEEIEVNRRLVREDPNSNHFKLILAMALNDRGNSASFSEDSDQTPLIIEALSIELDLTRSDPTNIDWSENLASTQQNLGYRYERKGNLSEAIKYYRAATEGRKKLSEIDPTNVSKLDKLVSVMGNIAYAYSLTGQLKLAEETFSDVVVARKKIIALDAADGSQQGRLIVSLAQLAKVQYDLGKTSLALFNVEEAERIGSELARADPSNTAVKAALVVDLGMIAMIKSVQGDLPGSISALEKMIVLSDQLAKDDPANSLKEFEVFTARLMLAISYRQQGKLSESLGVLNATKDSAARHEETSDVLWLNILSQFYNQMYLSAIDNDAASALNSADRYLAITKRWSEIDSQSDLAVQALGTAYTDVGISMRLLGRLDDAQKAILSGLEARKRLSDKQQSFSYAYDLSTSWSQLNAVLSDKADYAGALEAEQEALKLREQLAAADPMNFDISSDLASSYADVSAALEQLGDKVGAREALLMALKTRQRLARERPDRPELVERVKSTEDRLARLDQIIRSATLNHPSKAREADAVQRDNAADGDR
jgi:tetratricopeptide (TPR) repeat protein